MHDRHTGDTPFVGMDIADDAIESASRRADEHLMFERGDYLTADVSRSDVLMLLDVFAHDYDADVAMVPARTA